MIQRIKDVWYAVIIDDKMKAVFENEDTAKYEAKQYSGEVKVERVKIEIIRIKTS